MTRINHMALAVSSDDTKDSATSEVGIAEEDVLVSLEEGQNHLQHQQQQQQQQTSQQLRLQPIKIERDIATSSCSSTTAALTMTTSTCTNASMSEGAASALTAEQNRRCAVVNLRGLNSNSTTTIGGNVNFMEGRNSAQYMDINDYAEWIKCKNEIQRHCMLPSNTSPVSTATAPTTASNQAQNTASTASVNSMPPPPDADQSFLNSLHPFLKEMTGKQNRRFRQKVVALIDAILDNADG